MRGLGVGRAQDSWGGLFVGVAECDGYQFQSVEYCAAYVL